MRKKNVIALCLGLMFSQATVAQTVYQVSIGSYKNQMNAEKAALQATKNLGNSYSVASSKTGNGLLYRVGEINNLYGDFVLVLNADAAAQIDMLQSDALCFKLIDE